MKGGTLLATSHNWVFICSCIRPISLKATNQSTHLIPIKYRLCLSVVTQAYTQTNKLYLLATMLYTKISHKHQTSTQEIRVPPRTNSLHWKIEFGNNQLNHERVHEVQKLEQRKKGQFSILSWFLEIKIAVLHQQSPFTWNSLLNHA